MQMKAKEDEIHALGTGKARISRQLVALRKEKASGDAETQRLETQGKALCDAITGLMKELEELPKQADSDSKLIVEIMHERDILTKDAMCRARWRGRRTTRSCAAGSPG